MNRHSLPGSLLLFVFSAMWMHATTLFAISGDPNNSFVPDQFSMVDSVAHTVTLIATLGDGSLGFNGGLTMGPGGALYAIANDSTGAGSFYIVHPDGSLTLVGTAGGLGDGFLGGLAWDSADSTFYAAVNDTLGNTTLYAIDSGGSAASTGHAIGTGFSGLTYDPASGLFYGFSNDSGGNSSVCDFDLAGNETCNLFGSGAGAITYDAGGDRFFFLTGWNNASSTLNVVQNGSPPSPIFVLGDGFGELAAHSISTSTPDSASLVEVVTGLACLLILFQRSKQKCPN